MDKIEQPQSQLAALRIKYKIGQNRTVSSESFLYFILRKAELGIEISDIEFQWLAENSLFNAIRALKDLKQFRIENRKKLEQEFLQLRIKYQIPQDLEIPLSSPIYSILWKLDTENQINEVEIKLLQDSNCLKTVALIPEILNFFKLKHKYKATQYLNQFPDDLLYSILKKLDVKESLSDSEIKWLLEFSLDKTLEIYWEQEKTKKAEIEFSDLKSKYQVNFHPDTSISSPLYSILKKIKAKKNLEDGECKWLNEQKLSKLTEIDRTRKEKKLFKQLKNKYKITQDNNLDIYSYLLTILKKLESNQICEADIQWLTKENLAETAKIARQIHFISLKNEYEIDSKLSIFPFYEILLKLKKQERLDAQQVIELINQNILVPKSKIANTYYQLEAIFYEQEYQKTGNKWNLASESSNWRKANKSEKALQATEKIDWNKIKDFKLKSALLVTRGGAFRDIHKLNNAENCAKQAMECQPDAYQPYTLMGAICYDQCRYSEGDQWFNMAIERGAKIEDIDKEIKQIVKLIKHKDKRQELVKYLLGKDAKRHAWAKSYLQQEKKK